MGPFKARRSVAAADVRLAPFYSPASIGLRTFRGSSANAGWAVRCIVSRKGGHIFFVANSCLQFLLANNVR